MFESPVLGEGVKGLAYKLGSTVSDNCCGLSKTGEHLRHCFGCSALFNFMNYDEETVICDTTKITKVLAPRKKRSIAFEFSTCSCDHLECPVFSRETIALSTAL